ncbi:MAG TPA: hypothetical protein VL326_24825 [Kofleriaceae bacterium]|jgi:hypothetical protein|nr:hypothetical protein [Kofleriaceae bacterium]
MTSTLVVLVGALAACRVHKAPTAPPATRTPYLALFETGKTWTIDKVKCRVADVKPVGDATVARLACDAPNAGLLVVGTWVATPAGLYHPLLPVDEPDELALLGEDDLLLGANAVEHSHEHVIDGARVENEAFVHEGSWCVRETTTNGADSRSYMLCFDRNGITGGSETVVSDGATQSAQFGSVPPADEN